MAKPRVRRWSLVKQIYREFSADRIPTVSGGITFFFLLALFPAIASVVSLYGILADRQSILEGLQLVSNFLPGGAVTVLTSDIRRLVAQKPAALNLVFLINFVIALWSTSGGVKAIIDGLNIAFEAQETRSFIRLSVYALLFTLGIVSAASMLIYVSVQASHFAATLPGPFRNLIHVVAWIAGYFLCSTVFSVVYYFGPNRTRIPWRWISWGSALAALFWIFGTLLFTWYVEHFGNYNRTYGDLGAIVGFLTWVWLSTIILLTGAEIIYEIERGPASDHKRRARS